MALAFASCAFLNICVSSAFLSNKLRSLLWPRLDPFKVMNLCECSFFIIEARVAPKRHVGRRVAPAVLGRVEDVTTVAFVSRLARPPAGAVDGRRRVEGVQYLVRAALPRRRGLMCSGRFEMDQHLC